MPVWLRHLASIEECDIFAPLCVYQYIPPSLDRMIAEVLVIYL